MTPGRAGGIVLLAPQRGLFMSPLKGARLPTNPGVAVVSEVHGPEVEAPAVIPAKAGIQGFQLLG